MKRRRMKDLRYTTPHPPLTPYVVRNPREKVRAEVADLLERSRAHAAAQAPDEFTAQKRLVRSACKRSGMPRSRIVVEMRPFDVHVFSRTQREPVGAIAKHARKHARNHYAEALAWSQREAHRRIRPTAGPVVESVERAA